jgi:hypothetical protein
VVSSFRSKLSGEHVENRVGYHERTDFRTSMYVESEVEMWVSSSHYIRLLTWPGVSAYCSAGATQWQIWCFWHQPVPKSHEQGPDLRQVTHFLWYPVSWGAPLSSLDVSVLSSWSSWRKPAEQGDNCQWLTQLNSSYQHYLQHLNMFCLINC